MTHTLPTQINTPRIGTKLAKLVALLSRKGGVTIDKASEALAWQCHTTRATLTRLKQRGYIIERIDKSERPSVYKIIYAELAE